MILSKAVRLCYTLATHYSSCVHICISCYNKRSLSRRSCFIHICVARSWHRTGYSISKMHRCLILFLCVWLYFLFLLLWEKLDIKKYVLKAAHHHAVWKSWSQTPGAVLITHTTRWKDCFCSFFPCVIISSLWLLLAIISSHYFIVNRPFGHHSISHVKRYTEKKCK